MKFGRHSSFVTSCGIRSLSAGLLLLISALLSSNVFAAEMNEEQQLIQTLRSNASLAEKDAACARLKFIGTARCVPAIAPLLLDEQLSHSARYALESLDVAEAGAALLDALNQTKGLTQIGIINSLGARHERRAVPALEKILLQPTPEPASTIAAARALGKISGASALRSLETAEKLATGPLRAAIADAMLRCANDLLLAGSASKAKTVFELLSAAPESPAVRVAAYRGLIRSSGNRGLSLMLHALEGPPGPERLAALQLAHELDVPGTTAALAKLLPKTDPQTQLALIGALVQRHDAPATRDVVALAISPDPALRLAVINALGTLGDAYAAPFLAEQAAAGAPEIQRAARESLLELRHGRPTATLLGLLETAPPATQVEAARALGQRGDQNAAAPLMELAAHHTGATRKSALLALAFLATEQQLPALLQFVLDARDDTNRVEAAESVRSAYERLQTRQGHVDAEPLRLAMASASAEARIALLPVCSGLVNPQARMALRSALSDPDEDVRARALRALCDAVDRDYIPDLLTVVHDAKDQKTRTLAVTACVRLNSAEEPTKLPVASRIQTYKALLAEPLIPEQKRLVLAGLAEVPDIRALNLTEPLVEDNDTKAEAAQTAIKIATALSAENSQEALAVLRKALGAAANDASRQALEAAIARVEATSDYITNWQLAGPFRQEGKKFNELFDVPFPPEIPEEPGAATPAPAVKWQIVPAAAKTKAPYIIDLMPVFGGEQAVGYARTWIKSDAQQPVRMELGTDDGVKVWLNGKVVHSHNIARPLKPAEDIVELDLKSGWNLLLLKITQNNLGWEFCARLRKPDGSHIDNVSYESSH